jgi:hypothetical protein
MSDSTKFLITCGSRGIEKCEAHAYQITARQQKAKIAELEKERDVAIIAYENCMTGNQIQIRDLEQQAKGVEDLARESYSGMTAVWMIAYADRLKDKAKALKDQG